MMKKFGQKFSRKGQKISQKISKTVSEKVNKQLDSQLAKRAQQTVMNAAQTAAQVGQTVTDVVSQGVDQVLLGLRHQGLDIKEPQDLVQSVGRKVLERAESVRSQVARTPLAPAWLKDMSFASSVPKTEAMAEAMAEEMEASLAAEAVRSSLENDETVAMTIETTIIDVDTDDVEAAGSMTQTTVSVAAEDMLPERGENEQTVFEMDATPTTKADRKSAKASSRSTSSATKPKRAATQKAGQKPGKAGAKPSRKSASSSTGAKTVTLAKARKSGKGTAARASK